MSNENQTYRVLRLFGLPQEKVVDALRRAKAEGCKGLQLMENAGEYAVLIQGQGDTPEKKRYYCIHWEEKLALDFGDSIFGVDGQTLPKAAVEALRRSRKRCAAGSPQAVRLLEELLGALPGAHGAFDFGREGQTYAEKLGRKCPQKGRSALGYAAWQAACLYKLGEADLVVNACPGYALVYSGKQAVACPLPEGAPPLQVANAMLDLARREVLGLEWPETAFAFTPSASQRDPRQKQSGARRKRGLGRTLLTAGLCLALAGAGIFGAWRLYHHLGPGPESKGYGTLTFDSQVGEYLEKAMRLDEGVAGWLALPGAEGRLLYTAAAAGAEAAPGQAPVQGEKAWLLDRTQAPSNTVVVLEEGSAPAWESLEELVRANGAFTLYTEEESLACKVLAVYYYDENDEKAPFAPADYASLADTDTYRSFVVGVKARSLYDTGVAVSDADSFVTLLLGKNNTGAQLAVTGRVIRPGESAAWSASGLRKAAMPLYTAAQYAAEGIDCPDIATVNSVWENWYNDRNDAPADEAPQESAGQIEGVEVDITEISSQTEELLQNANSVLSGLTDLAGAGGATVSDIGQGAGGSLSEEDISYTDAIAGGEGGLDQGLATEERPEDVGHLDGFVERPPSEVVSGDGRTIDVTMNGVPQTMDLVECLAMIAQNELGSNQPAEAYKAQAVAAHSWILSQGSYPSVSGISYSSSTYEAVKQVATVLVTYNDKVCFTPYCASVSTGTVSCKEVWGTNRDYLQAVESPYDRQYARFWNTNGRTSGTARYSRETVKNRVQEKLGIDLSVIEDPNEWFKVLSRNAFGYVTQMQIGNEASGSTTCSGRWFRENLLIYQSVDGRTLRSCAFNWEFDRELDCYIFDVYGYGHGVGMSQWGCIGYAYNGWTYDQILAHYYTGTTLVSY